MKKILSAIMLTAIILTTTLTTQANTEISVYVDGEKVTYDAQPITKNGSTLVPLRQTFEALGADVKWNSATQTITANNDDTNIKLTIGNNTAYKDNKSFNISVPPVVVAGRTYVPLRFVAESFGADVSWDNATQTVTIKSEEPLLFSIDSTSFPLGYTFGDGILKYNNKNYTVISVDGGNLSGTRESNVAVDIGFGERVYWGLTNDYGQLVYVLADKITLQDPNTEAVGTNGRYYSDEAKVPGTESPELDEGHVIADSLGGVANAYNITPQNSDLNRFGNQAYMEEIIRQANGCTNFIATITYPNTTTQIPSKYNYEYRLLGNVIIEEFDNIAPETNITTGVITPEINTDNNVAQNTDVSESTLLMTIDTNGNGIVTITEAKAAGFIMPITSSHWLYKYMTDGDGDGIVGE